MFCLKSLKPFLLATMLYGFSEVISTRKGSDGTGRRSLPLTSSTLAPSALLPALMVARPFLTFNFGSSVVSLSTSTVTLFSIDS